MPPDDQAMNTYLIISTPQHLCDLAARLQYPSPRIFCALLSEAKSKLRFLQPQGIANIAWSMAQLGYRDQLMLGLIAAQARFRLSSFESQGLVNLAWAFAALKDTGLVEFIMAEAAARADKLGPQQMASLLESCASLGIRDER